MPSIVVSLTVRICQTTRLKTSQSNNHKHLTSCNRYFKPTKLSSKSVLRVPSGLYQARRLKHTSFNLKHQTKWPQVAVTLTESAIFFLQRLFGDTSKYSVSPTFGVSFGLPYGGGGGYPLNPYGPYPALNPYGGSLGGLGGVNLGPVNVNPLLSVQVTQDEHGDKIVKPLVNLHVTPNHGLVHKIGSLLHGLHHKPHYPFYTPYKHDHHHQHIHMTKPYPPYYYPHKPSYYYGSHYAPGYYGYKTKKYTGTGNGYYSSGYVSDDDDYDNGDDYVDDPYGSYSRHRRGNQTAEAPSSTSSSSSGIGTSRKVQFPSDRRRDVGSRTRRQADSDTDGQNEVNPVQEVRQNKTKNVL